jgi:hypothetical protein
VEPEKQTGGDGICGRKRFGAGFGRQRLGVLGLVSSVVAGLGFMAGCATHPAAPAQSPAVTTAQPVAGEIFIEITSEPVGAYILVNDQPSGRAPLRLSVKVTPQGFLTDYLTIKSRFVAKDATQVSQTSIAELTPRDKAPLALAFTPQGVQRRMR